MFCPPDYVPLSKLLPRWNEERRETVLRDFEHDWWNGQFSRDLRAAVGVESNIDIDLDSELRDFFEVAPADQSEQMFFGQIGDNLFMATPNGHVSRLDPGLIDHALGEFVVTPTNLWDAAKSLGRTDLLDSPHDETGLLDNGLLNAFRLTHLRWEQMAADLAAARNVDANVTPWQLAKQLNGISRHHSLAPFHERIGYRLSLRGYDLANELGLYCTSLLRELADQIRPFEGRALCVPTSTADTMLAAQPPQAASHQPSPLSKRSGRPPRKKNKLRDAYLEEYPNGHGGLSRGKLLSILMRKAGLKEVSLPTLDRMLRDLSDSSEG